MAKDKRKSHSRSRTYTSWTMMNYRCYGGKYNRFSDYGGRGISVCKRWRESFYAFLEDMGERPEGKSIDRFPDNNGNYEPGNCRWATCREQNYNTRRSVILTCAGITRHLEQWAILLGRHPSSLRFRIESGWPLEEVLEFKEHQRLMPRNQSGKAEAAKGEGHG